MNNRGKIMKAKIGLLIAAYSFAVGLLMFLTISNIISYIFVGFLTIIFILGLSYYFVMK